MAAGCSAEPGSRPVGVDSVAVREAEARRRAAGAPVREVRLRAEPATVDLGGVVVDTWTYGGRLPGTEVRLRRGEVLSARFDNALAAPSTVHWHGVALRADMDGVPGLTQPPVQPGSGFGYEFTVPDAGTYWLHPHVGVQLDRGLYAPLIVEDPADPGYDAEAVVILDDWLDGVDGRDPDAELARLRAAGMHDMSAEPGGGHGGHGGHAGAQTAPLGEHGGDVEYRHYLCNGRLPADPVTFTAAPRQRMRVRLINAAADTAFRVAVAGHRMTVTHSDGFPVFPVSTESLLIGMGERYDVTVDLRAGVFALAAAAEAKAGRAMAVIRTGPGEALDAGVRVRELDTAPLTAGRLQAADAARLAPRAPEVVHEVRLGADATGYVWTINDRAPLDGMVGHDAHAMFEVFAGQRVRLRFVNATTMFHPMHLHGHTGALVTGSGAGPRKDTVLVGAGETVEFDFDATNPGQWMLHCHNAYHGEAGMMSVLSYQA